MTVDKKPQGKTERRNVMFGNNGTPRPGSKSDKIAKLQAQVRSLEARLDRSVVDQSFTLSMVEFLPSALEGVIGASVSNEQVTGNRKVLTIGRVTATVSPFSRKVQLKAAQPTPNPVAPLDLEFNRDGKLDADQMRLLKGFLAELEKPVVESPFWAGVKVAA
jgi:hypothetical protein